MTPLDVSNINNSSKKELTNNLKNRPSNPIVTLKLGEMNTTEGSSFSMILVSTLEQANVHKQKIYRIYLKTTAITHKENFDIIAIE